MAAEFVHLHVHSQYSLLDGALQIEAARRAGERARHARGRADRPRQHVRRDPALQGVQGARHRADPRLRGERRAAATRAASVGARRSTTWSCSPRPRRATRTSSASSRWGTIEAGQRHRAERGAGTRWQRTHGGLVGLTGCMGGVVAQRVLEQGEGAGPPTLDRLRGASSRARSTSSCRITASPSSRSSTGILVELREEARAAARRDQRRALLGASEDAEAQLYLSCIADGPHLRRGARPPPRLATRCTSRAPTRWRASSASCPRRSQHARDRRDVQRAQAQARQADAARLQGAGGLRHRRVLPPRRARGPRAALRKSSPRSARASTRRLPEAPRDRARRHRQDEVPGLLPDRLGLHPLRQGAAASRSGRAAARAPARSSRTRCASPTSIPSRTTCSSSAS